MFGRDVQHLRSRIWPRVVTARRAVYHELSEQT